MNVDRPFQCDTCEKSFKLKFHLKRHKTNCKQFYNYVTCEDCGKKLVSKRVLKVHKASCNPTKVYSCSECEIIYKQYAALADHRKKHHSKTICDFCDHECHLTNLKRHIQNKHKGLRPSNSNNSLKTDKHQTRDEATKALQKKNKTVSWNETLEEVKEIAVNKVPVNYETFEKVLDIQKHADNILLIHHNRRQNLRMKELSAYIERQTHKTVEEITIKAMLSVSPDLYILDIYKNDLVIQMKTDLQRVTPSILANRRSVFKSAIKEIHEVNSRYIDLIPFPEIKKTEYKSPIDILKQNIVHFSDDEEEESEQDENMDSFDKLKKKIEKKVKRKQKEKKKIGQIDWQRKRLPKLARAVNAIYCSEQKSSIKFEILATKVGNNSRSTISDLERLIKESNGWLIRYKDWVRKKYFANINDVCDSLV